MLVQYYFQLVHHLNIYVATLFYIAVFTDLIKIPGDSEKPWHLFSFSNLIKWNNEFFNIRLSDILNLCLSM